MHKSSRQRLLWKLRHAKRPIAVFVTPTGARISEPTGPQFERMAGLYPLLGVYYRPKAQDVIQDIEELESEKR